MNLYSNLYLIVAKKGYNTAYNSTSMNKKKNSSRSSSQKPISQVQINPEIVRDRKVGAYKLNLNEELLRIIDNEREIEHQREKVLAMSQDSGERSKLTKIYGVERAKASIKIIKFSKYDNNRN